MEESEEPDHPFGELLLPSAPGGVSARLELLAADFNRAYAPNTRRTWRADWRIWSAFCGERSLPTMPATLDSLRAFLEERIESGRKRATLEHYLATLALAHRLAEQPWPLDSLEGKTMWRGLRRERLIARQRQAQGLTLSDVEKIAGAIGSTEPRDLRDAALLHLAYETMCRRSELIAVRVEDISSDNEDGSGRLFLGRAKADQEGEGSVLYVSPDTMARIERWLRLAGHESGPLFRSIPHIAKPATATDGGKDRYPRALSDGDVARIFKRRAKAAGVEDSAISGHSTRVGAAQDLLAENFSAAAVMKQGRWKSERMVMRYGENIEAGRGAMAQLLRRRRTDDETQSGAGERRKRV
jgi:integrase